MTTPFEVGHAHGLATGLPVSYRQVSGRYPAWSDAQITDYLNGRDDGARGDNFRVKAIRLARARAERRL